MLASASRFLVVEVAKVPEEMSHEKRHRGLQASLPGQTRDEGLHPSRLASAAVLPRVCEQSVDSCLTLLAVTGRASTIRLA